MREKILHGVRILLAFLLMSANLAPARAEAGDRTIGQFVHTEWSAKEGAPGYVEALAQTTDGFLWLGTTQGLFRFDGVSFERYEPRSGPAFQSSNITPLLALPNGDLWIGYRDKGVSRVRNGMNTTPFRTGCLRAG
jgi:ligand-binding sensor domain-containing protein